MTEARDETGVLLSGLARGDSRAVSECLRVYGDLLWAMAVRVASHDDAREEAAAEAFAAVWREAGRYCDSSEPEISLLVMIARRRLMAWRREHRDSMEPGLADGDGAAVVVDSAPTADARIAAQAVADLPSEQRRAVLLTVGHGLPPEAVARLMGTDEARTVASVRDALISLREALTGANDSYDAQAGDAHRRLLSLLADAVVRPLDDAERSELESLRRHQSAIDDDAMERCAAALVLALAPTDPMPENVRERILDRWRRWPGVTAPRAEAERRLDAGGRSLNHLAAYWLAGAGLVLALVGWWPTLSERLAAPSGPQERMAALLSQDADAIEAPWQPAAAADGGVSGRLVWSNSRQQGYMVLDNVRPNDPTQTQYQLWIFDAEREDYPVNGGVFNVPADKDSHVVPIDPELPVRDPSLFAITREAPGGVVVSDRERVVVTAKPGDSGGE